MIARAVLLRLSDAAGEFVDCPDDVCCRRSSKLCGSWSKLRIAIRAGLPGTASIVDE